MTGSWRMLPSRMGSLAIRVVSGFAISLSVLLPVLAADSQPASIGGAVNAYNGGRYSDALSLLNKVGAADANNSFTHYYKALCCQGLNQIAQAEQDYMSVYRSKAAPADLRYKAWQGLQGLKQLRAQRGFSGLPSTPVSATVAGKASASSPPTATFPPEWEIKQPSESITIITTPACGR